MIYQRKRLAHRASLLRVKIVLLNNVNIRAAKTPIPNKPVLLSSSDRTPLQLPLILDAATASSWVWDPLFSSMKDAT